MKHCWHQAVDVPVKASLPEQYTARCCYCATLTTMRFVADPVPGHGMYAPARHRTVYDGDGTECAGRLRPAQPADECDCTTARDICAHAVRRNASSDTRKGY